MIKKLEILIAIKETLVIENKKGIYYAVEKIYKLLNEAIKDEALSFKKWVDYDYEVNDIHITDERLYNEFKMQTQ